MIEGVRDGVELLGMHVLALLVRGELLVVTQDGVMLAIQAGLGDKPNSGYIGGAVLRDGREFAVETSEVGV